MNVWWYPKKEVKHYVDLFIEEVFKGSQRPSFVMDVYDHPGDCFNPLLVGRLFESWFQNKGIQYYVQYGKSEAVKKRYNPVIEDLEEV